MGTDSAEVVEELPCPGSIKVHRAMCMGLLKAVDGILKIYSEIEAARPRCSSGIEALCSLKRAIEEATLQIQLCSESSKLYLAITGHAILSRYKKSRKLLELSLSQIQNMVPVMLAEKISCIVAELRALTFSLDSSEEEAGKDLRKFLQQYASATDSIEQSAIETIQFAALTLNITSQKALLTEKRSIKKLIDKVGDSKPPKKEILLCLLNLLMKYGQLIVCEQKSNACPQHEKCIPYAAPYNQSVGVESPVECAHDVAQVDMLSGNIPPEEFKCPITSRLMFDPVIIASGQTFEKISIKRWFEEGHDTCPKTKKKLSHFSLTPNTGMKDLISKWCKAHRITIPDPCMQLASTAVQHGEFSFTSVASLTNSMNDLRLPQDYSGVSIGSSETNYSSDSSRVNMTNGLNLMSRLSNVNSQKSQFYTKTDQMGGPDLSKLDALSWDSQRKAVEYVKVHFKDDSDACYSLLCEISVEQLIRFLKDASNMDDVEAKRAGSQLLLAFVSKRRHVIQYLNEDAYSLLVSFLNSEVTEEALRIIEVLSLHQYSRSKLAASGALTSIWKMLDTQITEYAEAAIKILYNMSFDDDIHSLIVSLDYIPKLVTFLEDNDLARFCLMILKNLCNNEDGRSSIAEIDGCIVCIAKLLESDNHEDQEHAVDILLSLCSERVNYCRSVMDEGVVPSLFSISINGNDKGKSSAMKLLRLLRDTDNSDLQEHSSDGDFLRNSCDHHRETKSPPKNTDFFGVKRFIFSRYSFLAPKRKK